MSKKQEIALNDSQTSEPFSEEQIEPIDTIKEVLDERDFIQPLQEVQDKSLDPDEPQNSVESEGPAEQEIELSLDGFDFSIDKDPTKSEKEISFRDDDAMTDEEPERSDPTRDMPDECADPVEDDAGSEESDKGDEELAVKDDSEIMIAKHQTGAEEEGQGPEAPPNAVLSDKDSHPKEKVQTGVSDKNIENDFVRLEDSDCSTPEKATAQKTKTEPPPAKSKQKGPSKKPADKSGPPGAANGPSMINKMISFAAVVLIVAGFIFYNNPALIGLKKVSEPTPPPVRNAVQAAQPAAMQAVITPPPPGRQDNIMAKLEEATDLRNQLLEKKEEIDRLNLYYRNGIAELEENIYQEAQKEGISSFEQARKNKRIELNMRTIQRRRAYIGELEKPADWVGRGSEELLYLIRKAQLDMELIDIAGGIDMNRHKRHISAAIHRYRASADKLAINLQNDKLTPFEKIWQQANAKKNTTGQISLTAKDEQIAGEICSGNFGRISELTRISFNTARCLSRMKGSELFLNGVTQLVPNAAKELFQWQGNWVCLNGVKKLSPAVAQYLFKWGGNWISLNGLTEFQPELALYLLKWGGQQLELTGLKYNNTDAEQKTLKYLALWETTGGKLFVSDDIRKEMGRIMVSQLR
jgi:hypothetical protein